MRHTTHDRGVPTVKRCVLVISCETNRRKAFCNVACHGGSWALGWKVVAPSCACAPSCVRRPTALWGRMHFGRPLWPLGHIWPPSQLKLLHNITMECPVLRVLAWVLPLSGVALILLSARYGSVPVASNNGSMVLLQPADNVHIVDQTQRMWAAVTGCLFFFWVSLALLRRRTLWWWLYLVSMIFCAFLLAYPFLVGQPGVRLPVESSFTPSTPCSKNRVYRINSSVEVFHPDGASASCRHSVVSTIIFRNHRKGIFHCNSWRSCFSLTKPQGRCNTT